MAESSSEAPKSTDVTVNLKSRDGRELSIHIITDSVKVVDRLCTTATTLGALYVGYEVGKRLIDLVVRNVLGEGVNITPGSLHVRLQCSTDERLLEVLTDYESGKMKERLEEEFSQVGIKVKGLKVEIQNMAEVNEIREAICKRNPCEDEKNTAINDAKDDAKKNVENLKSMNESINELKRKQDQLEENLKSTNRRLNESKMKRNKLEIPLMAVARKNVQQSYDVSRFVGEVKEDLLCSICRGVPKDPRLCENKDHIFCLAHISRHLENSQTCPYCRDPLTPETLRCPTGILKNCLDDLKIKCDNHDRGCPDVIGLESLASHVNQCEFAPVMCGIEGCEMVVNKSEKENHEKNLCQFRNVKHYDYTKIKASQDEMKANQDEMKAYQDEMKASLNECKENLKSTNESLNESRKKYHELEENLKSTNESLKESNRKRNQLENDVREFKERIELLAEKFNRVAHQPLFNFSSSNKEIIIMGGLDDNGAKKSVIIFNPGNGTYAELPPMNCPRHSPSSCVYNNDVIVAGGVDGKNCLDSIEILRINQDLPLWTMSNSRLPAKLVGHVLKVYQEKLLVIGGQNDTDKVSNEINELALDKPYTPTLLATMPEPRAFHAAEIVNDKLFILGGKKRDDDDNDVVHDSVVVYDFITKEFEKCLLLPKPVCFISTVTWNKKIIVVGGRDEKQADLNDVIMYDTKSGISEKLPSLNHCRWRHSTVIINDVIFVFGGWNWEQGYLNSVERFTMGSDGWKELPGMKESRNRATAVVKP